MSENESLNKKSLAPLRLDMVLLGVFTLGLVVKMNYILQAVTGNYRLYVNVFRTVNLAILLIGLGGLVLNIKYAGRYILAILCFALTFVFFTIVWYFRYFGTIVSWADHGHTQSMGPAISAILQQIAKPIDILFIMDVLAVLGIGIAASVKKITRKRLLMPVYAGMIILAIILQGVQILAFNAVFDKSFSVVKRVGNSSFINVYGLTFFAIYDIGNHYYNLSQKEKLNQMTLIKPEHPEGKDFDYEIPVTSPGANLILIQVESLDNSILYKKAGGIEVTPFLNRLADENSYYDRFFAQHNTATVDADYSVLTSNYAGGSHTPFTFCDMTKFHSLPRVLKKNGYHAVAMHANRGTFYDRIDSFADLGFDKSYFKKEYPPPPEGDWALDDMKFLQKSAEYLKDLPQPFFAYIITITCHTPFDLHPEEYNKPEFDSVKPDLVRNYYNAASFTDASIARFMEKLSENGLLENSVIYIFGDHTSKIHSEEYSAFEYVHNHVENISEYPENVPLIIIHPDKKNERISKYCFAGDIPPTAMDSLGLHKDSTDWISNSLFSRTQSPILRQGREVILLDNGFLYRLNGAFTLWEETAWSKGNNPEFSVEYGDYVVDLVRYSNNLLLKYYE